MGTSQDRDDHEDHPLLKGHRENRRTSKKKRGKTSSLAIEQEFLKRYHEELEAERQELITKWKLENSLNRLRTNSDSTDNLRQASLDQYRASKSKDSGRWLLWSFLMESVANAEVFIANMPLTIGAVGLGWVTQGVVWFKFMEENIDDCIPVHFNSNECTYPEFPGCFECNTENHVYLAVVTFHCVCHIVAALCCTLFLLKLVVAFRVVADELSNPATATPCGVVCITMVCVAAGRGFVGKVVVLGTSLAHFVLAFWFLYQAIFQYRLRPDPGWFPNTVGISYAAIKTWLYYPLAGKFLMVCAMVFFFSTYFISLYRVAVNHKIAAPVCFIQLSAPSITLYAMTIMAQPSRERQIQLEADPALMTYFESMHHDLYIPVMHTMMVLSLVGMVSVFHSLWARWPKFRHKPFSPVHMAFVFPILSHTNAVQAYRSGVDSFAEIPEGNPFKIALFIYWFTFLIGGTILNLVFTYKYVRRLPEWTKVDISGEDEPAKPSETIVHEMLISSGVHETMSKPLVSPAVLQANEAGSLIRVCRGTEDFAVHGPYVRTRKVTAIGFDLIMSEAELREERAELLDWAAKNKPRTRNRTLSIHDIPAGATLDGYGSIEAIQHRRVNTLSHV